MGIQTVKDIVIGAIMGAVSFLPGASGSTIAVIFRIYDRLIADVADIRGKLFRDLGFIIPVGLGFLAGMILCAKGLKFLIDDYEIPMMFLFVALILTQIPDLKRMSEDGTPMTTNNFLAFLGGLLVMVALMVYGFKTGNENIENPGFAIMVGAGVIMAISMLAPGISGSTVLLALGLFYAYDTALGELDFKLLFPLMIGLLVGALVFAKVIDHFMKNSRKSTYMAILGLNVGSAMTVLIKACRGLSGDDMIVLSIVCIFIGAILGLGLNRLAHRFAESAE